MQVTSALRLRASCSIRSLAAVFVLMCPAAPNAIAQASSAPATAIQVPAAVVPSNPIAIVPLDTQIPGSAAVVMGALQVVGGKALIASNGSVTAGATTTHVALPQRGALKICASTTVKLAVDSSVPSGELPGLLMALDHGAIEASFSTGQNADTVLTPDFRILIGGPGASDVKVRLGQGGDTCVDNPGANAPYVLVTSVFDGRLYRVQPGQRVMFQHGSLDTVVDQEKEPCGCPPDATETQGNEFPLAQSEGLAPAAVAKAAPTPNRKKTPQATPPLVYNAGQVASVAENEPPATAEPVGTQAIAPTAKRKRPNFFTRMGHMFKRIFGAE